MLPRIGGVWEGSGMVLGESRGGLGVFRTLVMKVMTVREVGYVCPPVPLSPPWHRGLQGVLGIPRWFWGSQGVLGVPQCAVPSRSLVNTAGSPTAF